MKQNVSKRPHIKRSPFIKFITAEFYFILSVIPVGNAVPPVLAAKIGSFILESIFNKKTPSKQTVWKALGQEHLLQAEQEKIRLLNGEQLTQDNQHKYLERQKYPLLPTSKPQSLGL